MKTAWVDWHNMERKTEDFMKKYGLIGEDAWGIFTIVLKSVTPRKREYAKFNQWSLCYKLVTCGKLQMLNRIIHSLNLLLVRCFLGFRKQNNLNLCQFKMYVFAPWILKNTWNSPAFFIFHSAFYLSVVMKL